MIRHVALRAQVADPNPDHAMAVQCEGFHSRSIRPCTSWK
jgi:hypothetical protein